MNISTTIPRALLAAAVGAALAHSLPAAAADGDGLKLSGFTSLVAGRVVSGQLPAADSETGVLAGHPCPCYITDWANAGIYGDHWSMAPDSHVGLQARYAINSQWNAVAQVVVRGADTQAHLEWAYLTYAPSRNWEFSLGRKRIPLYFYSDFQDIGSAIPWVSAPDELYGWEATNYNGASARYRTQVGETSVNASVFAGREHVHDSAYDRIVYGTGGTDVIWSGLVGADLELIRGPLTVRGVYVRTRTAAINPGLELDDHGRMHAYGIAANLDFDNWFVLSEVARQVRDTDGLRVASPAYTLGAGYRWGKWTPFINYARYKEQSSDRDLWDPSTYGRGSVTLRYDTDSQGSFKIQYDLHKDLTHNYGGDANVVRVSYDRLF